MEIDSEVIERIETESSEINQEKNYLICLKQLMVITGVWTSYFMYGLCMGSPTVFIPQLRRDTTFNYTISEEMASWLSSSHLYSAVPGVIILSVLAKYIGRKKSFLLVSITSLGGFLLFYFSTSVLQIFISEITQGLLFACQITVNIFVATEYTSPTYRGVFMSLKVASFFWGIWIANAIGTFFNWRKIGILGILCAIFNTVTVFLWPESPYWLASKRRFYDCTNSHRWLKGYGQEAEKELKELIAAERELHKDRLNNHSQNNFKNTIDVIFCPEFYKPVLLSIAMMGLYNLSGKIVCSVYAIDIIKSITDSEKTAYIGMLTLDGITVLSMYLGGVLTKLFNRRTVLMTASSVAIILLFTISIYLFIIYLEIIGENKYFSILLLSVYSISISFGPVNMCTTVYGELVSLKYRCSSMIVIGMVCHFIMATVVKVGPLVFRTLKLHGAFLFYAVSSTIFLILLYKYLPETKDKTLQEIQRSLNKTSKKEETKELM